MPGANKPRERGYTLMDQAFSKLLTIHSLLDGTACGLIGNSDHAHTPLPISRTALGHCFAYYAQQISDVLNMLQRSRAVPDELSTQH